MGGCEACGTALRLSNCMNEPVSVQESLLYICCLNSESGEISGEISLYSEQMAIQELMELFNTKNYGQSLFFQGGVVSFSYL